MRKTFLLAVLIVAAQGLPWAQEARPPQADSQGAPPSAQAEPAPAATQLSPAPRLGHPLDPADVDILTGKAKVSGRQGYGYSGTPYGYTSYPVNAPLFSQSVFAPVSTATQPPFVPRFFGRIGGPWFVVIDGIMPLRPFFFFSTGGFRHGTTVFVAPARRAPARGRP